MKKITTEEEVKNLAVKLGWKPGKSKPSDNGSIYQIFTKDDLKIWIGQMYIEHQNSAFMFDYPFYPIIDAENFINTAKFPEGY
jgi:hypothetical protein